MNKRLLILISIVVDLLFIGAGIGLAFAFSHNNQNTTASVTSSPTTVGATLTPPPTKGKVRTVRGTIQSLSGQSFVLTMARKKTLTVLLNDSTKYASSTGPATVSDLKVGLQVEVKGTFNAQDQTLTAQHVMLLPSSGIVPIISGSALIAYVLKEGRGGLFCSSRSHA